jgi:hypothetical protein
MAPKPPPLAVAVVEYLENRSPTTLARLEELMKFARAEVAARELDRFAALEDAAAAAEAVAPDKVERVLDEEKSEGG